MAELSKHATKVLDRHIAVLAKRLNRAGFDASEIDAACAGTLEQVHGVLDESHGDGPVDDAALINVLAQIEQPDDWVAGQGPVVGQGIGVLGLLVALVTLAGLVLAGVFQEFIGGDGGAVSATIGLFGFGAAIVLGIIGRRALAGRAAIILSAVFVVLFLAAWAASGLFA